MPVRLTVRWKDEKQQVQEMERVYTGDVVNIGRNIRNEFCIPSSLVTRFHAKIELKDNTYLLYDLDSTNGTYLNSKKVEDNEVIKNGDQIEISGFNIEFTALENKENYTPEKTTPKDDPSKYTLPSTYKTAYDALEKILNYASGSSSFQSSDDIEKFGGRLQKVLEIFFDELSLNLEVCSKFQHQLGIKAINESHILENKGVRSGKDIAKFLLDLNSGYDTENACDFLRKISAYLGTHQMAVLKVIASSPLALLEKISPESIQDELDNKQSQESIKGFMKISPKILWKSYAEKHKELLENDNKRFEIIAEEFQKFYSKRVS